MGTDCVHGYRITDTCPNCDSEQSRDLAFGLEGDARLVARTAMRLMAARPTKEEK